MMEKKTSVIVVFGMTLLMGLILSVQVNSMQGFGPSGLVLVNKLNVYKDEMKKIQEEKKTDRQLLLEYEEKIAEIENEQATKDAYSKELVESLEKYKIEAGVLDVEGPGFIVTIKESAEGNDDKKDEIDEIVYMLIQLVNKLKFGGAEAVSINGQRILATAYICYVGDNIEIDSVPIAPPYIVRVIGDPSDLEYILNIKYGIVEQIRKKYSFQVDVKKYDVLEIPRYTKVIKYRYAKPVITDTNSQTNGQEFGTD